MGEWVAVAAARDRDTPTENAVTEKFRALVVTKNGDRRRGHQSWRMQISWKAMSTEAVEHSRVNYKAISP
jgi:hypothetical protein